MKTNKISIAMFVLLLSALVFASTVCSAAPVKEPKEPPLEKEHKFEPFARRKIKKDKPAYSNSDDIKMSKNGRVISTGTELVFLDDMGNISKRKPIKNGMITEFSPDGTLMLQNIPIIFDEKGVSKWLIKLYDANGGQLWERENLWSGISYYLSQANNGVVIVPSCVEELCGRDITLLDKHNVDKVIYPDVDVEAKVEYIAMSDDGNYFAAGYYDYDPSVAYFDISGNQLWVKHFEKGEEIANVMGVSPKGNYVIVLTVSKSLKGAYLYIYNKKGDLLLKDVGVCRRCKYGFDQEERHAVLVSATGAIIYDLKAPKFIAEIKHNLLNKMFFENVDVSSGLIAIGANYKDDTVVKDTDVPKFLYLYSINGDLLYKKKIVGHDMKVRWSSPQVKIIDNGRRILVKLGDKVQVYKNEFAK